MFSTEVLDRDKMALEQKAVPPHVSSPMWLLLLQALHGYMFCSASLNGFFSVCKPQWLFSFVSLMQAPVASFFHVSSLNGFFCFLQA